MGLSSTSSRSSSLGAGWGYNAPIAVYIPPCRTVMSSGTGSGSSSSAQGGAGKSVPAHGLFQFFPRGTPGGPSGMDGSKFVTPVEGQQHNQPDMRAAAASILLASAAQAFVAPTLSTPRVRSALTPRMAVNVDELGAGVTAPTGFFDPLKLSKNANADLKKWREAELKHGRVAMLATVGYLVQEAGFHPLFGLGDKNLGLAAFHFQEVLGVFPLFWLILLYGIGSTELNTIARGWQDPSQVAKNDIATLRDDYLTGDLGYDPFDVANDPAKFFDLRTKELNNGRLAMISIIGMWGQELATGRSVISTLPFFGSDI